MAFTMRLCPYCGAEVTVDEEKYSSCQDCKIHIMKDRLRYLSFYDDCDKFEEYDHIVALSRDAPDKAMLQLDEIIDSIEEKDAYMYLARSYLYAEKCEDGKTEDDLISGLKLLKDPAELDSYMLFVSEIIVNLIHYKERDFIAFDYVDFIDSISAKIDEISGHSCKGVLYITVYRNLKARNIDGVFDDTEDFFDNVVPRIVRGVICYSRNYRTTINILKDVFDYYEYDDSNYIENDTIAAHCVYYLMLSLNTLSVDFSNEDAIAIFNHWNDENMRSLEEEYGSIIKSAKDKGILKSILPHNNEKEEFDVEDAIYNFAKKYLLLLDEPSEQS